MLAMTNAISGLLGRYLDILKDLENKNDKNQGGV